MATSNSTSSSVNGDAKPSAKPSTKKAEDDYTTKAMLNAMSEALENNFHHLNSRLDEIAAKLDALPPAASSSAPPQPAQIVFQAPGFKPFKRGRGGGGGRGSYYGGGRGFPRL
jgi:hypothetical protein